MLLIKSIMKTDVITVKPQTPILEAIKLLTGNQISGMPVVTDDNRVVGILTEKDVLRILTKEKITYEDTVSLYMSRNVTVFNENDPVLTVSQFFERNPIRRVPIVRDGILVGIVSRRDIIAVILEAKSTMESYRFS
ncbi:MAG: CBS domain-containing protein [Candidatus Omnitrophota bacterium]|nr:CBS domain-containing protein [Candidatus Omnitrophota bacterium]MDZ4242592.1 CBS domain-containing protein [Candidatus Omnitrophota bacterium]